MDSRAYKIVEHSTSPMTYITGINNLVEWVEENGSNQDILLAHMDDGVIWGEIRDQKLVTSHDVASKFSPPLIRDTLQMLRLFNQYREIRLWSTTDGFAQATIEDNLVQESDGDDLLTYDGNVAIDENHLLWGTRTRQLPQNFMLMIDGQQGLRHAIPNVVGFTDKQDLVKSEIRLCLHIRHYLREVPVSGVNQIAYSRLVGLGVV